MSEPKVSTAEPRTRRRFFGQLTNWFSQWADRLGLRRKALCPRCANNVTRQPRYRRLRVCDHCGYHFPMPARQRIKSLVDARTFSELRRPRSIARAAPNDLPRLRSIRRATHLREAVIVGTARVAQQPVVIVAFDFRFLGGTMSVAVGEEITRAFEYAAQHQLPLVAVIASGGVRIQQGMPALLQMAKTTQAVQEFQSAGCPFLAVLSNPSTGGVYASFVNLADILLAEPGAIIGFAGPRVAQALTREKMPADSHTAESAYAHGLIDAIVQRDDLRGVIARLLVLTTLRAKTLTLPRSLSPIRRGIGGEARSRSTRETLALARRADRPSARDYIPRLFADFVELHGDRVQGDDTAIVGGLAQFENAPVVVIAQQRGRGAGPEGYRKAERLIHLAERFRLPIITFIDTPGADPGDESERHGIATAIAHCLAALLQVLVPTVSVIIGEGTSGGALALTVTDRVLMLENAVYCVISPEGASAILFGDTTHATETADALEMTTRELLPRGIVDCVIREPDAGAHADVDAAAAEVKIELQASLSQLRQQTDADRLVARRARYRHTGIQN